eukprot:TRINITY_DN2280_c0_g1_i2.p1 TRINITY_DN2280_c0_g1~~TRINITY_DN2280_c0_g1_i2.p1  ORF type:complete len:324 (-),score=69.87 TRINITY_DN2280_c0_g1_i2:280-1251(-)
MVMVVMVIGGDELQRSFFFLVKIWDILKGQLLHTFSNHQKTVTCLAYDPVRAKLFSGSLDQQVKIYSANTYQHLHNLKYPGPILSLALSPASTHFVVGMSDGILSIRHRASKNEDTKESIDQNFPHIFSSETGNIVGELNEKSGRGRGRGRGSGRGNDVSFFDKDPKSAVVVQQQRREHLTDYEHLLVKFKYAAALDSVLKKGNPLVCLSMLEELIYRNAMAYALSGRRDDELIPFLFFVTKQVTNPQYAPTALKAFQIFMDIYSSTINQSPQVHNLCKTLNKKLQREITVQEEIFSVLGVISLLFNANTSTTTSTTTLPLPS